MLLLLWFFVCVCLCVCVFMSVCLSGFVFVCDDIFSTLFFMHLCLCVLECLSLKIVFLWWYVCIFVEINIKFSNVLLLFFICLFVFLEFFGVIDVLFLFALFVYLYNQFLEKKCSGMTSIIYFMSSLNIFLGNVAFFWISC